MVMLSNNTKKQTTEKVETNGLKKGQLESRSAKSLDGMFDFYYWFINQTDLSLFTFIGIDNEKLMELGSFERFNLPSDIIEKLKGTL
jgi:hypothetical protein